MIVRFHQLFANAWFRPFEYQDEDGNIEIIKLVKGTNEVRQSKQDKNAKEKDFLTGVPNKMVDGEAIYETEITDKAVLNYLQKRQEWGKYIYEYDPLAESKAKAAEIKKQVKTLMDVNNLEDEDLLKLGYVVFGNRALQFAKDNDYDGLKIELSAETQSDPDKIDKLLNDKSNGDRMMTGLAFAKGVIIETEAGNSVSWGDNKAKIVSVREGFTPIDAMIEFYKEVEGREVKKLIYSYLVPKKGNAPEKDVTNPAGDTDPVTTKTSTAKK